MDDGRLQGGRCCGNFELVVKAKDKLRPMGGSPHLHTRLYLNERFDGGGGRDMH
jgi:hypothetical protein